MDAAAHLAVNIAAPRPGEGRVVGGIRQGQAPVAYDQFLAGEERVDVEGHDVEVVDRELVHT